ncbi:MAG: porin family protein [Saprospiraceae bacterium]
MLLPAKILGKFGFLFLVSLPLLSFAQLADDEWFYGLRAGATYSQIDGISTSLIRPIYPEETYTTALESTVGFTAGAFVYMRFNKSKFAIQPEIGYADMGGRFLYSDINDFEYNIDFRYNYLRLVPAIKFYPAAGLNITVGSSVGFILNAERLDYTSNKPELGPDLQIQQSLRQALKGRGNVGLVLGAGYELPMGLGLDVRYIYGFADVIETQANGFYFIESKNANTTIEATLSYAFPFFR